MGRVALGLIIAAALGAGHCGTALGQAAVGTSVSVSTVNSGSVLSVSSAVSGDLRYVGVNVDVQFSTLEGFDLFSLTQGNVGSTTAGGTSLAPSGAARLSAGAQAMQQIKFGKVMVVDHDKPLLAKSVKPMELKQVSLKGAVKQLADVTGENMVLGIKGMQEAGVDVDVPRDYKLADASVEGDLLAILKTAAPEVDMVMTAEEKVITVTTQKQADNTVVTKTYYVEDLLANLPKIVAAGTDLNTVGQRNSTGAGEGGNQLPPKPATASTNIVDLITSTVRPEIWKVNGGKIGEIGVFGNHVRVTAPQSVQAILDGPKVFNPNAVPLYVQYGQ